ncbi:MAG: hypothetical protein GF418_13510 [Chitinivibrionales bacterium]|nr:hypothetical protein [Chitinivibrionales bacterium]MBD3396637.1 hypothetical protein [Chitinivibrionales bacterium]
MNTTRIQNLPAVRLLLSLRTTVACLFLLAVLVLWGTFYQVDHGLYAAQERFFHSWILLVWGVVPFPGAKLVVAVLSANLMLSILFRFVRDYRLAGLLVVHLGIALLFASSAFTYYFAEESFVTLAEGGVTSSALSYHDWELAALSSAHPRAIDEPDAETVTLAGARSGSRLVLQNENLEVRVLEFHANCEALGRGSVDSLVPKRPLAQPAENIPCLAAEVRALGDAAGSTRTVRLHGADPRPAPVVAGGKVTYLALRRRRIPLPARVRLVDFTRTRHPGTSIAKSFESRLRITGEGIDREVAVSMNRPFRHGAFTFFQTSYAETEAGEMSTLAVVKNTGRLLPYIASIAIALGMLLHYLFRAMTRKRKKD